MGLLTETVEIKINNRTYKHFEDLGYEIPRHYNDKKKKMVNNNRCYYYCKSK